MMARIFRQVYLLAMRWLCFFALALCLAVLAGTVAMVASVVGSALLAVWALADAAVPLTLGALDSLCALGGLL